jgi:hypothetical protein
MNTALRVFVVWALVCQLGFSQTDPWERVKLIEKGKTVSVILASGVTVSGKMDEWQPDGLVVRKGKDKTVTVARADVAKVYLVAGMSRGRRSAWAFGIGTAAGAGLYGAAVAATGGVEDMPAAAVIIGGGLFIGGISAGIAALIPQHKELIYTAAVAAAPAKRK